MWNKKSHILPDTNKLIECRGYAWCSFVCIGKFIKLNNISTFHKLNVYSLKKTFINAVDVWYDVEYWRYITKE